MPDVDLRPHQRRVLAEIASHDQISRTELGRRLDLPKATLTAIVRELLDRGLVVDSDAVAAGTRGRPATVLTLAGRPTGIGVLSWSSGALKVVVATPGGRVLAEDAHAIAKDEVRFDTAAEALATVADRAGYVTAGLACVVLGVPAPYQRGVGAPARGDGSGSPHGYATTRRPRWPTRPASGYWSRTTRISERSANTSSAPGEAGTVSSMSSSASTASELA